MHRNQLISSTLISCLVILLAPQLIVFADEHDTDFKIVVLFTERENAEALKKGDPVSNATAARLNRLLARNKSNSQEFQVKLRLEPHELSLNWNNMALSELPYERLMQMDLSCVIIVRNGKELAGFSITTMREATKKLDSRETSATATEGEPRLFDYFNFLGLYDRKAEFRVRINAQVDGVPQSSECWITRQ